jgi:hypothetical protein
MIGVLIEGIAPNRYGNVYPLGFSPRLGGTVMVALALLAMASCRGDSSGEFRVEADTARKALDEVLTSWNQGALPESWRSRTPPVIVQDLEWSSGVKLESYEVIGDCEAIDANLHCEVKLKLSGGSSGATEKTVTYLVSTSPVLTVFRAAPQ